MGLSTMGIISLGISLVAGKNLVPLPATGMTAFLIFIIIFQYKGIVMSKYTLFFVLSLLLLNNVCLAYSSSVFDTTRLKSTAGAGAGSVLLDEGTVLNPATQAFFNISAIYLQKGNTSEQSNNSQLSVDQESKQLGVVLSDANERAAGSLSYHKYQDDKFSVKRFGTSMAYRAADQSSIGISHRIIQNSSLNGDLTNEKKYNTTTIGIAHVFTNGFSLGIISDDFLDKDIYGPKGTIGAQYVFKGFLSIMGDFGSYYKDDSLGQSSFYKVGAQFSLVKDLYLRIGTGEDKKIDQNNSGIGLSWVQPRLMLDFAFQRIRNGDVPQLAINSSNSKETCFSLSYRF